MIDILVSTFGESKPLVESLHKNLPHLCKLKVVHQQPEATVKKKYTSLGFDYYTSDTIGLSKSRNIALSLVSNEIGLIADDDVSYIEGFENTIVNAFETFSEADIIVFRIVTPNGRPYKQYWKDLGWLGKRHIFKPSSIEMAFRCKSIQDAKLQFDENFGLGARFPLGEEAIFISDALKKGLKIRCVPLDIVVHPYESTGKIYTNKNMIARGAQLARIFGYPAFFVNFAFFIKLCLNEKKILKISLLPIMFKGTIQYFKEIKNS